MPDRRRPRPVARLRAARPPRRRSAAARTRGGQGRALRRRSAAHRDRAALCRPAAPPSRRRRAAEPARCLEPQPERRGAAPGTGVVAAAGGQPVRLARRDPRLPGRRARPEARRRRRRALPRARSRLRPPPRRRARGGAERHQGVGRQLGAGGGARPPGAAAHRRRSRARRHPGADLHRPGRGDLELAARPAGGRPDRRPARDPGAVAVPAPAPDRAGGGAGDPVLAAGRAGAAVLRRPLAQHPVDDGPDAGGRHAGRQRGGGAGEHLPPPRARALADSRGVAGLTRGGAGGGGVDRDFGDRVPAPGAGRAHRDHHLDRRGGTHHHLHAGLLAVPVADRDPAGDGAAAQGAGRAALARDRAPGRRLPAGAGLDPAPPSRHPAAGPAGVRLGTAAVRPGRQEHLRGHPGRGGLDGVRVHREPQQGRGREGGDAGRALDPGAPRLAARQVDLFVLRRQHRLHARLPAARLGRQRRRRGAAQAPARAAAGAGRGSPSACGARTRTARPPGSRSSCSAIRVRASTAWPRRYGAGSPRCRGSTTWWWGARRGRRRSR